MNPHCTYILVDISCVLVPLLFSFHPRLRFYNEWRHFLAPCLLTALFFLVWDALFTRLGVWSFNERYVLGIFIAGMPLEEYLFFICIPFASMFSYHAFTVLLRFRQRSIILHFSTVLATLLLAAGLANITRLYSASTFLLLSIAIYYCVWKRVTFLQPFFACFLIILIPFLLSNGILTGSFFGKVVVMYNDAENLGIRLLSIPVEDIFYAMLLLLINTYGFELSKRSAITSTASFLPMK